MEAVERNENHGGDEESEEAYGAYDEGGGEVEVERGPVVVGVDDVGAGDAYAEQDVHHGSAEAGGEAHDGREHGDGHVRDEVRQRVPNGKDRDADDGVREAEEEAERLRRQDLGGSG